MWKRKLLSAKNHNQFRLNHEKNERKKNERKRNKRKKIKGKKIKGKNKGERIYVMYKDNILSILRQIIASHSHLQYVPCFIS